MAVLIGVDWGTTRLRAYLIGDGGETVARIATDDGLMSVADHGFEAVLTRVVGGWHDDAPDAPILMSGMVGSRQGWLEAPYVGVPASLEALAAGVVPVHAPALGDVAIVPGVAVFPPPRLSATPRSPRMSPAETSAAAFVAAALAGVGVTAAADVRHTDGRSEAVAARGADAAPSASVSAMPSSPAAAHVAGIATAKHLSDALTSGGSATASVPVAPAIWADVMRGEETEVFGALAALGRTDATLILPGTHAKWVTVEAGVITGFRTYMTGDVFAAVGRHTILERMLGTDRGDRAAFARGLAAARDLVGPGDLLTRLFSIRAEGLMGRLGDDAAASFLSGLLIGAEVASGAAGLRDAVLVGASELAQRYGAALEAMGVAVVTAPDGSAARGLARIAAGMAPR